MHCVQVQGWDNISLSAHSLKQNLCLFVCRKLWPCEFLCLFVSQTKQLLAQNNKLLFQRVIHHRNKEKFLNANRWDDLVGFGFDENNRLSKLDY